MEQQHDELNKLCALKLKAPENTMTRLRQRLQALLLGRDLAQRQAFAFWVVLNAFFRVALGPRRSVRKGRRLQGKSNTRD